VQRAIAAPFAGFAHVCMHIPVSLHLSTQARLLGRNAIFNLDVQLTLGLSRRAQRFQELLCAFADLQGQAT